MVNYGKQKIKNWDGTYPEAKLCECGCGQKARLGKRFICGHGVRIKMERKEKDIDVIYEELDIPIGRLSSIIDRTCGVYMLNTESGKRYIGSSLNIRSRIWKHKYMDRKYKRDKIKNVSIFITETLPDARTLEAKLIILLKPELNGKDYNRDCNRI